MKEKRQVQAKVDKYTALAIELAQDTKDLRDSLTTKEYAKVRAAVAEIEKEEEKEKRPEVTVANEKEKHKEPLLTKSDALFVQSLDLSLSQEEVLHKVNEHCKNNPEANRASLMRAAVERTIVHKDNVSAYVSDVHRDGSFVERERERGDKTPLDRLREEAASSMEVIEKTGELEEVEEIEEHLPSFYPEVRH